MDRGNILVFVFSGLILCISLFLKLPSIEYPFFGHHLFRQLQTLSTIEAYMLDGFNLLAPRTNYIGYPGNLLLEAPIFQGLCAWISGFTGSPMITTRIINILIGLASAGLVFRISNSFYSRSSAVLSSCFFLMAPINLMYHASTLVDPMATLCSLVATHIYLLQKKDNKITVFRSLLFLSTTILTLLIKPLYYFPICLLVGFSTLEEIIKHRDVKSFIQDFRKEVFAWLLIGIGGLFLMAWLYTSSKLTTAQDVSSHLGWSVLKQPSFYFTIYLRFFFYIQNPFTLLFSIFGVFFFIKKINNFYIATSFASLPFLYYLVFADINRPHDYYSLILVPYLAILAGAGVDWIRQNIDSTIPCPRAFVSITVLGLSTILSSYLYFSNYWISPNTTNRYEEISSQVTEIIEPFQYSLVWVDENGDFSLSEYLAESRRSIILSKLGNLDEEHIRQTVRPIYEPPLLYALNHQYGEMWWYSANPPISSLPEKIIEYEGHLRYLVTYMSTDQDTLKSEIQYPLVYESSDLLVFDLKK